ncbi:UmoC family flagellar biogenesis regulator [Providencia huaxiensis]|uniref:lysozyme inhibitor LprI family protein n=1 Tax=Providencia TaxID=586 RepID=UPI000C7E8B60|nr:MULTISPECIES: lysozyme inhibitor LprI family protein [Providencia]AXH64321.1 DUF1311 domain-containing protein [Providencia huaxiensis]MBQ0536194.1 DUF1311 domain-containing protein [Providencia huaxiensis]MBQ0590580.1 DUF1311 domain-containing protein [Providencia huaxiensis]MCD2529804.1 DUF1311 domain-containing protein [Providencia huaxiensis]MDI7241766.1 DUF1311 domain-containing protein [Providencia huaxiensis]
MKLSTSKALFIAAAMTMPVMVYASNVPVPGLATDPLNECYEQIADAPRTAVQACLQSKLDRADEMMSKSLADNETELKKIDSSATAQAIASLKKSQDAFLAFRTSECQRQGDALLGGSGIGDVMLACKVKLTYFRIEALSL